MFFKLIRGFMGEVTGDMATLTKIVPILYLFYIYFLTIKPIILKQNSKKIVWLTGHIYCIDSIKRALK